jgi:hypothetical protein
MALNILKYCKPFMLTLAICVGLCCQSSAFAQEKNDPRGSDELANPGTVAMTTPFTNDILRGTYSFVDLVSTIAGTFGTLTFDGSGHCTGRGMGNTLIFTDAGTLGSMVFQYSFTGTYSVNADGTGSANFVANLPGGATKSTAYDFVIIQNGKDKERGKTVAFQLTAVQRERDGFTASFGISNLVRFTEQ